MTEWITLQEAADMIGVRKGTLCMWRLRDRFPFRSKGKGRGLLVSRNSVESWLAAGGKAGVKAGRPSKAAKAAKAAVAAAVPTKVKARRGRKPAKSSPTGKKLTLHTELGLEDIQRFITSIKEGKGVKVCPEKKGYVMTLED